MKAPVQTHPLRLVRLSRISRLLPGLLCAYKDVQGQALYHIEISGDRCRPLPMSETGYRSAFVASPSSRHGAGWKPMCAAGSISTIAARASAKSPNNFRCFDTRRQNSRGRIGGRAG